MDRERFKQAGEELLSLLESRPAPAESETDRGWEEIMKRTAAARRRKRTYIIMYSAAAMLCGIVFAGYFIHRATAPGHTDFAGLFNLDSMPNVKEITLLTHAENMTLENDAKIEYGTEGCVKINEKVVAPDREKQEKAHEIQYNQIIVPKGKRSSLVFTDGTKLSINSGTRIVYPVAFATDKREIYVQGEVYIRVAPESERPFYVKTENFDIKVTGTSFNVSAYREDTEASVVLVEGSVEMISKKNESIRLLPGQKLTVDDDEVSIDEVDVDEYILWKDNILYLGNYKNCGEILNTLARFYNVTIEYDENIRDIPVSGKLDLCERIEDALDILSVSVAFTYVFEDGVYHIRSK
ncbi:MAG: FecR domain-containing protein [Tannerellaceae bacterium]|nr:FecR domain-containing protein [Tannerellaceae bacterium]